MSGVLAVRFSAAEWDGSKVQVSLSSSAQDSRESACLLPRDADRSEQIERRHWKIHSSRSATAADHADGWVVVHGELEIADDVRRKIAEKRKTRLFARTCGRNLRRGCGIRARAVSQRSELQKEKRKSLNLLGLQLELVDDAGKSLRVRVVLHYRDEGPRQRIWNFWGT